MRGGVSLITHTLTGRRPTSPRAWGCFRSWQGVFPLKEDFPTCVGVFPLNVLPRYGGQRLPHVRGGVSTVNAIAFNFGRTSPRAWGCFLINCKVAYKICDFPTCVGVFPMRPDAWPLSTGLPHVRGGVSVSKNRRKSLHLTSPRAWGCFPLPSRPRPKPADFPTCVGVFPVLPISGALPQRLPHVRGGGSFSRSFSESFFVTSPRAWGCFQNFVTFD